MTEMLRELVSFNYVIRIHCRYIQSSISVDTTLFICIKQLFESFTEDMKTFSVFIHLERKSI